MPPVNKLQFDATGAETALAQAVAAFRKYNAQITEVTNSHAKFNKAGKLVQAVFQGITESGANFTAKIKNTKTGLAIVETQAKQTAAALRQLQTAQKAAAAAQATSIKPKIESKLTLPTGVDKTRLDQLLERSLKGVKSGAISGQEFENIFKLVRAGNKQALNGILEDTRQSVIKVVREYERLKDAAAKAASTAQRAKYAPQVKSTLDQLIGSAPSNLSSNATTKVQDAIRNIQAAFKKGTLSQTEFITVTQDTFAKTGTIYDGASGKVQKYVQTIISEYKKANDAAQKLIDKQNQSAQRSQQASAGGKSVLGMFNLKGLDPAQLERVYAQVNRIQDILQRPGVTNTNFQNAVNAFKNGVGPLRGAEEQIRASLAKIQKATDQTGKSFDSLKATYKLFVAELAYDFASRIVDKFKQMSQEAADFQRRIALIQTLSQDTSLTFNDWAEGIKKVSDKQGLPTEQISSAAYDLLSNQITKGADTFKTLNTIGDFARATDSGIEDSVNLVSSAINSYRLSAADAKEITNELFTAIDLGRVKAGDLANTFGRVSTTMASLGGGGLKSFRESLSLITVLTRQGIQPDTSQTLITNVLQKLLRPTKELQKVYDDLGVNTGELFVKTYGGVIGALEKLQQVTKGSKSSLADFFNEIRGFQGGNILIDRLDEVKKDLSLISNASKNRNAEGAVNLVNNNAGQKFNEEVTKITNLFTTKYKTAVLETIISWTNAFGGLAHIVETAIPLIISFSSALTTRAALVYVISLTTKFGGLTGAITAAAVAAKGFAAAFLLNPATYIVAAAAAVGYLVYQAHQAQVEFESWPEQIRKANEELKANYLNEIDQKLANIRNKFREISQEGQGNFLKYLAGYSEELSKIRDKEKETSEELKTGLNNELDVLVNNARSATNELEQGLNRAKEAAKAAAQAMRDLQVDNVGRFAQRAFHRNDINMQNARTYAQLTGSEPETAAQSVDQSNKIFRQQLDFAKKRADVAAGSGDLSGTLDAFKSINGILDQMAAKTQKSPIFNSRGQFTGKYYEQFTYNQDQTEGVITGEYQRQLAVLDQIRKRKLQDAEVARQQLETNKKLVETLADLAKKIGKFTPFDNAGKLKDEYKDASEALKELIDLQSKFNEAANKLRGAGGNDKDAIKTYSKQRRRIQETFGRQVDQVGKETETERIQAKLRETQEGLASATEAANRAMEKNIALAKEAGEAWIDAFTKYRQSADQALKFQVSTNDNSLAGKTARLAGVIIGRKQSQPFAATQALQGMDTAVQKGDFKTAREQLAAFEQIAKQYGDLQREAQAGVNGNTGKTVQQIIDSIRAQFDSLEKADTANKKAQQAVDNQANSLRNADAIAIELENQFGKLGTAAENFGVKAKTNIDEAKSSIYLLIDGVNKVINSFKEMDAKATNASRAALQKQAQPEGKRLGGRIKYANAGFLGDFLSGAFAKGTDNVPIMVNSAESIMNAQATRRFYPQIIAMNRGIDPTPRGGANPITNVGGINVTVHGGDTGKATVNEIVSGINRAARRGAIKLGRN